MKDLAGVDDSDEFFSEVDEDTEQHLRETAARAVKTRRGTIREFPDRYVDLASYVQAQSASVPGGAVAMGIQEDLEQDPRVLRAQVVIGAATVGGRVPFSITITTVPGAIVTVDGES